MQFMAMNSCADNNKQVRSSVPQHKQIFKVQVFLFQDKLLFRLVNKCQHFTGPYCIVMAL
jgi:hypothetical protein